MQYDDQLKWAKALIATRLSNIKAAIATNAANIDEYQQAIFDCSLSTAELGGAEALAMQAGPSNHLLLLEMAEINAGLTIKSVSERIAVYEHEFKFMQKLKNITYSGYQNSKKTTAN